MQRRRARLLLLAASSLISLALAASVYWQFAWGGVRPQMRFYSSTLPEEMPAPKRFAGTATAGANWLDPMRPEEWKYFLPENVARRLYPISSQHGTRYDPWTYYSEMPNQNTRHTWTERPDQEFWWRTNSLGLREDGELSDPPADWRVLVAGDSHTVGACNNDETFPNLLEAMLEAAHPGESVDVINAAMPGFSFYQYAGTLHKFRTWAPQVFVVTVYGGNDFAEISLLHHRFSGIARVPWEPEQLALRDRALEGARFSMGQCFNSIFDFRCRPEQREPLLRRAVRLCSQVNETCLKRGITLLVVYIPAACDCEWQVPHEDILRGRKILALTEDEAGINARLGEEFQVELAKLRIGVLDLRPVFAREAQPPFWKLDLHLNLAGHRLIAKALLPEVESVLAR